MTGKTVGNWYVIERGPNDKQERAQWKCQCLLCNKTIKLVTGQNLRTGQSYSCGCQKMNKMRQSCIKDETGKIYGYLKVLRQATEEEKANKIQGHTTQGIYWVCECLKCGNQHFVVKGDYLRNGDTKSCGCLISNNESKIAQLLIENNITFKQQYTFSELTSTGRSCDKLPFDFAIFENNKLSYLIEYDGEQHFSKRHAWNEEAFKKTQTNDMLKNNFCFSHNIPLIRIPCQVDYSIQDLILKSSNYILTPTNITRYYNKII